MRFKTWQNLPALTVVIILVTLAGCSGPAGTSVGTDPVDSQQAEVNLAGTETFDVSAYTVTPPPSENAVEHDVPEDLMSGVVGNTKSLKTVSGFRIQIHSSLSKDEAVAREQEAARWWSTLQPELRPSGLGTISLPVYLHFQQPYYRVRIGNFGSREEAQDALDLVQDRFPSAFIAIDTVRIYR